jgi:hypothetical protein
MDEDFWINIVKNRLFYKVEKWSVGEDRILFVEKKKCITYFGAKRYARRCIINHILSQYIKEKK